MLLKNKLIAVLNFFLLVLLVLGTKYIRIPHTYYQYGIGEHMQFDMIKQTEINFFETPIIVIEETLNNKTAYLISPTNQHINIKKMEIKEETSNYSILKKTIHEAKNLSGQFVDGATAHAFLKDLYNPKCFELIIKPDHILSIFQYYHIILILLSLLILSPVIICFLLIQYYVIKYGRLWHYLSILSLLLLFLIFVYHMSSKESHLANMVQISFSLLPFLFMVVPLIEKLFKKIVPYFRYIIQLLFELASLLIVTSLTELICSYLFSYYDPLTFKIILSPSNTHIIMVSALLFILGKFIFKQLTLFIFDRDNLIYIHNN